MFIAGEVFFRFRARRAEDGLSAPLQLQMLPAEMLPLNRNEALPGGGAIRQGIEFDRIGRRVAYHFLRRHPSDVTDPGLAGETVRVPAAEIVHVIDPVEAGQLRGVSRFAPGVVKLFLLDQYDDAELDRKKVAAMHALFITTPAPAEPFDAAETESGAERTMDLQPGQVVMLEPGEQVQISAPADVGQTYEAFQYRTLLQVSAALGVPLRLPVERHAEGQLLELAPRPARVPPPHRGLPARRRRLAALPAGLGALDGRRRARREPAPARLRGPPVRLSRLRLAAAALGWVDPLKDARAEIEQIEAGLKSRSQAIAERGYDAEQVDAEIAADKWRERELGLAFGKAAAEPAMPDEPPPDPNDEPTSLAA